MLMARLATSRTNSEHMEKKEMPVINAPKAKLQESFKEGVPLFIAPTAKNNHRINSYASSAAKPQNHDALADHGPVIKSELRKKNECTRLREAAEEGLLPDRRTASRISYCAVLLNVQVFKYRCVRRCVICACRHRTVLSAFSQYFSQNCCSRTG